MVQFFSTHRQRIGIDLGTNRTRIWTADDDIAVDEPTAIAIDQRSQKVIAVGLEAQKMQGRVGESIEVSYPVRQASVVDAELAAAFLKILLQRVIKGPYFFRPLMMVSVSPSIAQAEREALVKVMYDVGAAEVYTIAQPLAAAIGAGVPIADSSGTCLLNMGGGIMEAALVSLSSLIDLVSTKQAGEHFDDRLQYSLRDKKDLILAHETTAKIKERVASLEVSDRELSVTGKDVVTGAPREVIITTKQVNEYTKYFAQQTVVLLKNLLSRIPAELTADVIDKGMLLTGGLAQLDGLDKYLVEELGVAVSVVDTPDQSVITGIGTALEHLELFRESLGYQY